MATALQCTVETDHVLYSLQVKHMLNIKKHIFARSL